MHAASLCDLGCGDARTLWTRITEDKRSLRPIKPLLILILQVEHLKALNNFGEVMSNSRKTVARPIQSYPKP